MTLQELKDFESKLSSAGYKKITSCKATETDDYEYYKAFYRDAVNLDEDKSDRLKYQIFFEVWDFEKYQEGNGYSVSITIMPESCNDNVGRRDLKLSVDWSTDIERVEKAAEEFYNFLITKIDRNG
jgi:hypothetical protein